MLLQRSRSNLMKIGQFLLYFVLMICRPISLFDVSSKTSSLEMCPEKVYFITRLCRSNSPIQSLVFDWNPRWPSSRFVKLQKWPLFHSNPHYIGIPIAKYKNAHNFKSNCHINVFGVSFPTNFRHTIHLVLFSRS